MSVRRAGVLRLIDTHGDSPKGHYVNLAEYRPQALHVGNQDPLRRRLTLFTPHFPQIGAAGYAWRCPLCSLAGERRELAVLPKRQGVGDRRPSKEVSVLAEPLRDEGVQCAVIFHFADGLVQLVL